MGQHHHRSAKTAFSPTKAASAVALSLALVALPTLDLQASDAPEPLEDPIPQKIPKGDIVVSAVPFLQLPRTSDPHDRAIRQAGIPIDLPPSDAHARIQQMQPVGDGSGRLAISDLRGVLYLANADGSELAPYLDFEDDAGFAAAVFPNEAGLLGFAFHPGFADKSSAGYGKFYTASSATSTSGKATHVSDMAYSHHSVIKEWTTKNPGARRFAGTSRELIRVGQFAQSHNIGTLAFNRHAPHAAERNLLYVCMGDGGSAYDPNDNGQTRATVLGAILRIDPLGGGGKSYTIPADNPFAGEAGSAPEIWAYGLRHPQHFSFDTDGRLFINDIGQNQVEEVNLGVAGGNYGWHLREGTFATGFDTGLPFSGSVYAKPASKIFIDPVAQYDHDEGNAIGGGYVYRGSNIPALQGKYVIADIVTGRVFYFDANKVMPGQLASLKELRIRSDGKEQPLIDTIGYANTYAPGTKRADLRLGIDESGELYLLSKGDGRVRKLVPATGSGG